jgi:pimeloyl-ACP methyl ester carboxylesterase
LISNVVAIGPAAAAFLPRAELEGSEVLAASDSVVEMLMKMLTTEPRAALRTIIAVTNPQLGEDELRGRVERTAAYLSLEAAVERARAWIDDDVSEQARALGDRLWILHGAAEPFYEDALAVRARELFPSAHIEEVGDGPVSRPEGTAAVMRRLTAP